MMLQVYYILIAFIFVGHANPIKTHRIEPCQKIMLPLIQQIVGGEDFQIREDAILWRTSLAKIADTAQVDCILEGIAALPDSMTILYYDYTFSEMSQSLPLKRIQWLQEKLKITQPNKHIEWILLEKMIRNEEERICVVNEFRGYNYHRNLFIVYKE